MKTMDFKQWLAVIGKSPRTSQSYAGAISGAISSWGVEAGLLDGSLDDVTELEDFKHVCDSIRRLEVFKERNTVGKGMYSAALRAYADYLADMGQNTIEEDIGEIFDDTSLSATDKAVMVNIRIGQGQFRERLISEWGGCAVTGYSDPRLLVASHIKPWSKACNHERLDPYNGLLLLPNLDKAFDLGFISFEESGAICVSEQLEEASVLGVDQSQTIELKDQHQDYMGYHREVVFRG